MRIQIIGNDIEIDGEKVARILDIRVTLNDRLQDYITRADMSEEVDKELTQVENELREAKNDLEAMKDEVDESFERGYKEGKDDAAT
ncbi:MAG: hypothetical protein CMB80_01690 [Flammeovirgaceae bacterium]|nr:hypothetical protein [Flammeovirgaceae bacterium]